MPTSFTIPRSAADRLIRLGLACDTATTSTLAHIGVRVTAQAIRFSATNSRMLASLLVPIDGLSGEPTEAILDRDQFIIALKTVAKIGTGRITVDLSRQEARLSNGTATAVVRRVSGGYPLVDHVWSRPAGRRWVPTLGTLDGHLVGIAHKISGSRQALLFASPVEPSSRLEQLWETSPGTDTIGINDLRAALSAPAYWADHELAILIMPVTRSSEERQLDLSAHVLPASTISQAA